MKKVLLFASLVLLMVASGCRKEEKIDFTMSFEDDKYDIKELNSILLSRFLTITPVAYDTVTVDWSSSNEDIASVDNNGNVYGKYAGLAVITASSHGKQASCIVEVKEVKIDEYEFMGVFGNTYINSRTFLDIFYSPIDASLAHITWTTSNPKITPKYSEDYNKWYIEASEWGDVDLTVHYPGMEDQTANVIIDVNTIDDINVSPDAVAMTYGQTKQLTASAVKMDPDYELSYPENFVWSCSPEGIVSIDQNGLIKALSTTGVAVVKCAHRAGGPGDVDVERSINVNVTQTAPLTDFNISTSSATISLNNSTTVTVTSISPFGADPSYIEWTVRGDESLVSLSTKNDGSCTIKAGARTGECKVVASCNGVTREVDVNVRKIDVESITLKPKDGIMFMGNTYSFSFTYTPDNASLIDGFKVYVVNESGVEVPIAETRVDFANGGGKMILSLKNSGTDGNYKIYLVADRGTAEMTNYLLSRSGLMSKINYIPDSGCFPDEENFNVTDLFYINGYKQSIYMKDLTLDNSKGKAVEPDVAISPTETFSYNDDLKFYYVKNTKSPFYAYSALQGTLIVKDINDGQLEYKFSHGFESQTKDEYLYRWYDGRKLKGEGTVKDGGTIKVPQVGKASVATDYCVYPTVTIYGQYYDLDKGDWYETYQLTIGNYIKYTEYQDYSGKTKTKTIGNAKSGTATFKLKYATYDPYFKKD